MIKQLNVICWVYIRLRFGVPPFQTTAFCFSIARPGDIQAHGLGIANVWTCSHQANPLFCHFFWQYQKILLMIAFTLPRLGVSIIGGTPKSSSLIIFSLINRPFGGTPMTMEPPTWDSIYCTETQVSGFYKLQHFDCISTLPG